MIFAAGYNWPPKRHHEKAIVTLLIGPHFVSNWMLLCKDAWCKYSEAHGYDLILITDYLDPLNGQKKSPAWQKCLILNQSWSAAYERILWLDSDILISKGALHDIALSVPDRRKVGVAEPAVSNAERHILSEIHQGYLINKVPSSIPFSPHLRDTLFSRVACSIYRGEGIISDNDDSLTDYFNTGVLLLTPEFHNELLLEVYQNEERSRMYEQSYLSYKLIKNDLVSQFSARFNWDVLAYLTLHHPEYVSYTGGTKIDCRESALEILPAIRRELEKAYFLHFNGCMNLMKLYQPDDFAGMGFGT